MAKYSPPGVLFNNCSKFDLFLRQLSNYTTLKAYNINLLSYFAKKWKDMYKRKSMVRNQDLMDY